MAIRFTCPSCEAPLTIDDERAGKKVRCGKCEEIVTVPARGGSQRKREEREALQEGRKIKAKARSRNDDDEEARPSRKKARKNQSAAPLLLLALGGAALLFVVVVVGGIGVWWLLRISEVKIAQADPIPNVQPGVQKIVVPDPAPRPQPVVQKELPKVVDPNAGKALPDSIDGAAVQRVKKATMYLRVTLANGQMASGTGFLAVEKGMVVTNAHVVGMLQPNSQPPRVLEVVLYSGQASEVKMPGQLLGVDRTSDLAFIRVNHPNLPPMLPLDTERPLFETQKVYVFGFPLGERLGKEITVSPSAISALRNDKKSGELEKIQVNGGMQPGNSGGPVVNAHGSVVGIAVSIISGTQINFAIPVLKVQKAMEGRISETRLGQAFLDNGQIRLPVKVVCLDPLGRINQSRVEVWTGLPGKPRPYATQQPAPQPGDSARETHEALCKDGVATLDLPLPAVNPGQVYWVQPVVTTAAGMQWGEALATSQELYPIERKPANLTLNFTSSKERSVKLKSSQGVSIFVQNENKNIFSNQIEMDLLEIVSVEPKDGFRIRTAFGATRLTVDAGGKSLEVRQPVVDLLRQVPPVYIVDPSNRFQKRVDRLLNPQLQDRLKKETQAIYGQLCTSIEAVMLNIPNRVVQPQEKWPTKLPLMLRGGGQGAKPLVVDLVLTCTYEGVRKREERDEGFITVTGRVQGRDLQTKNIAGDADGKLAFDIEGGFISFSQLTISTTGNLGGNDVLGREFTDIELTRKAGNAMNIPIPAPTKGPAGTPPLVAKGQILVNASSNLFESDPLLPNPRVSQAKNARMKVQPIQMQAGKTYIITLDSDAFDAYLVLLDAKGNAVAEDDDSGGGPNGLNSRIEFRCTQTGPYRIIATSFDGKVGPYQLRVQEAL